MRKSRLLIAVLVLPLVGCSEKNEGEEGGPCYRNGTCDDGLVCLSNLCIKPLSQDSALKDLGADVQQGDGPGMDHHQPDHALPDRAVPDRGIPDFPMPDRSLPDKAKPDHAVPDLPLPDQAVPDKALPDLLVPDLLVPDSSIPATVSTLAGGTKGYLNQSS